MPHLDDIEWRSDFSERLGRLEGQVELIVKAVVGNGQPSRFELERRYIDDFKKEIGGRVSRLEHGKSYRAGVYAVFMMLSGLVGALAPRYLSDILSLFK